jgi:signal transduction histidine kinase
MHHGEPTARITALLRFFGDSTAMPWSARAFRLAIGGTGLVAALLVATRLTVDAPVNLLILLLLMVAAELLLSIRLKQQRVLSLGATFSFVTLLKFGAAAAVVVQVAALLLSELIRRVLPGGKAHSRIFIIFNAGQLAICGLASGLAVQLVFGTSLWAAPTERLPALLHYSIVYLVTNIALTSIATWLRFGWREVREQLWPNVSLWTALSFALSAPIALFVVVIETNIGFVAEVLLAFSFLTILGYIVRINLRYQETNRELQALNEISHKLTASLDQNNLFPAIYESVRDAMPVDIFLIGLLNEDLSEVETPYLIEEGELLAPRKFPVEGSLTEQVLRRPQARIFTDQELAAFQKRFGRPDRQVASVLLAPLYQGDTIVGVISAQSFTAQAYTQKHLHLFASIGRIAGVAINNARLYAREKDVLRSREEFVSLVAHELKNPLAALIGHAQILERRIRFSDEKLRRPVTVISEQAERMSRLVEDLLDLSRADSGRLTLHLQRLEITSLIRHVVDQHRDLTTLHTFHLEQPDHIPLLEGDVMRLTQVLQNLISNAMKYSPNGGPIEVSVRLQAADDPRWQPRLRKIVETAPLWVVVDVRDRGIGVPPEHLHQIFERFYRAANTAQAGVQGTGLGLSVVDGLIRAHGGVVWAESTWGEGSIFSFGLPVPPHAVAAYQQASATQAPAS